tara:strand:+ start:279 stop:794 length:516 start_codon:yes stop_codon:yes gene_type:complete
MSELRTNRIVPRDGLVSGASGGIIQVVQNVQGIGQVNSGTYGTSEYDIGLNCTITPQRSDSKILISANWPCIQYGTFTTNFYLNRGTTHIHMTQLYSSTGSYTVAYPNMMYLDSPSTTSAVTYKISAEVTSGHDLRTNYNLTDASSDDSAVHGDLTGYGSRSTMLLMEVSG